MASTAVNPSSFLYFYGRITREEAGVILRDKGALDGLYLLRESIPVLGNYTISICYRTEYSHYSIEKQLDGTYMIPEGRKFKSPIDIVHHHETCCDGLVCRMTIPCNRNVDQLPIAFRGMSYEEFDEILTAGAKKIKKADLEKALGPMREQLIKRMVKDLHQKQPWYHGMLSRDDADTRMCSLGHQDGKFLVRQRKDKKSFALSVSLGGDCHHYKISVNRDGKYMIEDGPRFGSLMVFVDNYHNKLDGLLCKLTTPYCAPGFDKAKFERYLNNTVENLIYQFTRRGSNPLPPPIGGREPDRRHSSSTVPVPQRPSRGRRTLPLQPILQQMLPDMPASPTSPVSPTRPLPPLPFQNVEEIYQTYRRNEATFHLLPSQINLLDDLGAGQFGSVKRGIYFSKNNIEIPVAVKTLKNEDIKGGQEPELIKEAKLMQKLDHKNIVRMIGLCQVDTIMLVLELAPLGPLNKYLPRHKDMSFKTVLELMLQVANGMKYLESQKFIHRDLAARNVLLVSENHAKISDFGMSKAIGRDSQYYEFHEAGRWPLKWYSPECIMFWKFDSKSDIWSYGVTLWESMSFGDKPYRKMKGPDILTFLQQGHRLAKPPRCPDDAFQVMLSCWEYQKDDRPNFAEVSRQVAMCVRTAETTLPLCIWCIPDVDHPQ